MFSVACFHCFVLAVHALAGGPSPSEIARVVYGARVRLAERIRHAWVREGWTHVTLRHEPATGCRVGVFPVMLPWTHGAAWEIGSSGARALIVSALAQGVRIEDVAGRPIAAPEVHELRLQLEAVDTARGMVS